MKKISFPFFFSVITLFLFPLSVFGQNNFDITQNNEYKVQESGTTLVTDTVTIQNRGSNYYPKQFILTLQGSQPENVKAYETGRLLKIQQVSDNDMVTLTISFDQVTVGKGSSKTFVVTYEDKSLAKKTGEIWEISVPKTANYETFKEVKSVLSVPLSFGDEAYVSPEPNESKNISDRHIYTFSNEDSLKRGVTAGFGKFQVFTFRLNYQLQNTDTKTKNMEIALPPDTAVQKVFYESIEPKPKNVLLDEDGNWIAHFDLAGLTTDDIMVKGSVQIFASPRKLLLPDKHVLSNNLQPTSYWQSDSPEIKKLAEKLKTPEEIYKYVSTTLKYDTKRIELNSKRLGALSALQNPDSALCSEYTDAFIAIARAAGIPAREINGFAYSQNPDIEPLSLVTDVLHAWPEYWDDKKLVWVPIDPTWASTTGGTDFFNKFDLRHFTFVIHGENPVLPYSAGSYKLGSEPEKDVYVTFGQLPDKKYPDVRMSYYFSGGINLFSRKLNIKIGNYGTTASYDNSIDVILSGKNIFSDKKDVFLPFSHYETTISVPYGIMASKVSDYLTVSIAGRETRVPTNKTYIIVNQLLFICIILMLLVFMYFIYSKRTDLKKLFNKRRDFDIFKKD